RTGSARHAGVHVPGGRRSGGRERLSRDRATLARRVLPFRHRRGAPARRIAARGRRLCGRRHQGAGRSVGAALGRRAQTAGAAQIAMPTLIFGLLVLALVLWALNVISKVDPKLGARVLKAAGGLLAIGFAVFLGLRGEIGVAIPLGVFGLGLLGWIPFGP